jgi:glutamyl-tRNA reductase
MHLLAMGLNHKTAAVCLRERLTFKRDLVIESVGEIMHSSDVNAAVLVSTCNRTEIYLEARAVYPVLRWLKLERNLSANDLKQFTYLYTGADAVRHLMQVACGLDSMVFGEGEILGQLKAAYQLALHQGHVNKSLSRLFESAFAVAKKVRSETEIGVNPVSVAYLAVRLAERIFAQISDQTVLIVGAGDTARLVAKHLARAGVQKFMLANRTLQRSQLVAQELGIQGKVEYIDLGVLPNCLARADIVVSATSAQLPIIGKGMVETAIKTRKHKPMFMIDLAMPRDIESQVREISDVYLYGIDDLQEIAAEHKRGRHSAQAQAETFITHAVEQYMLWQDSQCAVQTIQAFRSACEKQRDIALQQALRQLDAGRDPKQVMQKFAHVMLNRLIHQPTVQMREASVYGNAEVLALVKKLFNIESFSEL